MERQAVLLIHGVGEQKPMDTLRAFVDSVWVRHTDIHHSFAAQNSDATFWSKPDSVSDSFELRRLTTLQNKANIKTDFYEFYWQHLLHGTTYGHVFGWLATLLLRRPKTVPRQLVSAYWLLWFATVAAIGAALYTAASAATPGESTVSPWISAAISVALVPAMGFVVRSIIGDAARYLHVAPPNIQCRHAIRQAGTTVLDKLHERGYERVIVVGHSLGSVIGFDILTSAWPRYHRGVNLRATPQTTALQALESLAVKGQTEGIREAQRGCFEELKANGNVWRVTDFITLGSPLAHAAVLLARDRDELAIKQQQREIPTCLPTLETITRKKEKERRFSFQLGSGPHPDHWVPHHAAIFGPTRWTNLYFPSRFLVRGDLIGGPLREVFGAGVRDVPVSTTQRGGFFSHTLYWRMSSPRATAVASSPVGEQPQPPEVAPAHIIALREAVDLMNGIPVTTPTVSPLGVVESV